MKNDVLFDDDAEEYLAKNKNKKHEKSSEELLKEEIYNRRVKLVALSKTDYRKFIAYLTENATFFKTKMNDADRECMRRTCQRAWDENSISTIEELDLFNKTFGPWIDPRKSKTIPVFKVKEYEEPVMTIEEEIAYRSRGSYYAMWDFISNPKWQEQLKGRTDLYDKVKYMIDRAKENNESVLPGKFKLYEPSDEEMYVKVLNLMKVKE